jgi:arsenate reductase (thioredoxin)
MPKGVLFICLGNSCRSIMAEALARHFFPHQLSVASAGLQPLGYIAEETLLVLGEAGIATEGLWSKGLSDVNLALYRVAVNLTGYELEAHMPRTFQGRIRRHPVVDPFGRPLEVYREAREAIRRLLTQDLPAYLGDL